MLPSSCSCRSSSSSWTGCGSRTDSDEAGGDDLDGGRPPRRGRRRGRGPRARLAGAGHHRQPVLGRGGRGRDTCGRPGRHRRLDPHRGDLGQGEPGGAPADGGHRGVGQGLRRPLQRGRGDQRADPGAADLRLARSAGSTTSPRRRAATTSSPWWAAGRSSTRTGWRPASRLRPARGRGLRRHLDPGRVGRTSSAPSPATSPTESSAPGPAEYIAETFPDAPAEAAMVYSDLPAASTRGQADHRRVRGRRPGSTSSSSGRRRSATPTTRPRCRT